MKKILSFLKTQAFYYTQQAKAQKAFDSLTSDEQHLFLMLGSVRGNSVYACYIKRALEYIMVCPERYPEYFRQFSEELKDQAQQAPNGLKEVVGLHTVLFLLALRGARIRTKFISNDPLGEEHYPYLSTSYN